MLAEVGIPRKAPKTRARSGGASPRGHIAELQRARLISAAVLAVDELGWTGTTVAHITSRARVSRRTFYDLFENREDCLRAVLEDIVGRIAGEIAGAQLAGLGWVDRVRGGLFTILSFFDREPVLARLCVVQAVRGGSRVLVWREDILTRLATILDEGRDTSARSRECTVLTAEGLVGAGFAIVHARLMANKRQEPLTNLLGELMSMIVLPYRGPAVARSERHRSLPSPPRRVKGDTRREHAQGVIGDTLHEIPMRLTYRTARVLDGVASTPGASNRMVADHAGITDQGQISKLLARLEKLGLIENASGNGHRPTGEPNAWCLTARGRNIESALRVQFRAGAIAAEGGRSKGTRR
jgi:AcrR family transcriptional regulator